MEIEANNMESSSRFKDTIINASITLIILIFTYLIIGFHIDVEASTVYPPTDLMVTPVVEGKGLNISWCPEGSNAVSFLVYLVVDSEMIVPLGSTDSDHPFFIHTGLVPGQPYKYIIWPLDEEGALGETPSEEVVGWPREATEEDNPLYPPLLNILDRYVSTESVVVSGSVSHPGSVIEVEAINLAKWQHTNHTIQSSKVNGWFIILIDLMEGNNLVHARVTDAELGSGEWSDSIFIHLDLEPPQIVIDRIEGPYEVGSPVVLTTNGSIDNTGISRVEWNVHGHANGTAYEPIFTYIPTQDGHLNITLTMTDLAGNQASRTIQIEVMPERSAPCLNALPSLIMVQDGEEQVIQMNMWIVNQEYETSDLTWFVSGGDPGLFTSAVEGSLLMLMATQGTSGRDQIQVHVEDPNGKSDQGNILVVVESRSEENSGMLLPLVIIILALLVSGAFILRTSKRYHKARNDVDLESSIPFYIKSLYLIHDDGRLIFDFHSAEDEFKDPDMVSGMFTAIQDFIKDSFNVQGSLENIIFGENHLSVTHGKYIYMATVSYGALDQQYIVQAQDVIRRIEAEFAGIIEDWDGSYAWLDGAKKIIRPLLKENRKNTLEDVMRKRHEKEFFAVPSIEFQHGFVKYIVNLRNKTDDIIVDPYLDIQWDRHVLHLARYEPEDSRSEGRFRISNLYPNDENQVMLYFDPQVCLESFIRCNLTYMDINGKIHTQSLKNVLADVSCPIFFTVNNANTAMLRKLIEDDLENIDTKVYRYTEILKCKDIFSIAKDAVQAYDIQFVMDYIHEDPFIGEAWYYGETKIYNHKAVIRLIVREEDHTVEFLVATSIPMIVTGLLAEIGKLFLIKMDKKYTHGYNVNRVVRRLIKDESIDKGSTSKDPRIDVFKNIPMDSNTGGNVIDNGAV